MLCFVLFEAVSHHVAMGVLELTINIRLSGLKLKEIHLSLFLECWGSMPVPHSLAKTHLHHRVHMSLMKK